MNQTLILDQTYQHWILSNSNQISYCITYFHSIDKHHLKYSKPIVNDNCHCEINIDINVVKNENILSQIKLKN